MTAAVTSGLIDAVLAQVLARRQTTHDALTQALRSSHPGIHISVCGEDDVSPRLSPAAENDACAIYYVASGEHCLSLTNDASAATGIVVALREEE